MAHIFINPNNEYPRHIGDLYLEHPDFDGVNLPEGWRPVNEIDMPEFEFHQMAYEEFPKLIDGEYFQSWVVKDLSEEDLALKEAIRDQSLL
jgi:hypothetical protein